MQPINKNKLNQQAKNEETTKLDKITPIIQEKWKGENTRIVMEYGENKGYVFTDGKISVDKQNNVKRGERKKVDYLLLFKENLPLALVEAKAINVDVREGVDQARIYARMLDVPFAYSCNGKHLMEIDMQDNETISKRELNDFPTPNELWNRYKIKNNIIEEDEKFYLQPYYNTSDGKKPRYYQRIAINRTIDAIIKGQNRILLVMATGTGKTFTAFHILWRMWKSKKKKKILYLADRDILISQTMKNDFKPFKDNMCRIENIEKNGIPTQYDIYMSLYHQLKNGNKEYYKLFDKDFFDLIIVDECHRSSIATRNKRDEDEDTNGNWHDILEYFNSATQIGLTATPKETNEFSTTEYFGKAIYEYSLRQGIEDGFLAPYKVIAIDLDIDVSGYTAPKGKRDMDGNLVEGLHFEQKDFDRKIVIDERRKLVAKRISDFLKSTNRYAKTIVFCEDTSHALEMKHLIEMENKDLIVDHPNYVVRITGNDKFGKPELDRFISPYEKYPVIVVTSRLMSTGVDSQTTEIIVLDKTIGSMSEFKQIIGRGTRIKENYTIDGEDETYDKMFFTILDFRKNYLKFSDPSFNGKPEDFIQVGGENSIPTPQKDIFMVNDAIDNNDNNEDTFDEEINGKIYVNGVDTKIINERELLFDSDGKPIDFSSMTNQIKNNIIEQFPTIEDFIIVWLNNNNKKLFANELFINEEYAKNIRKEHFDDFDILINIAYGIDLKTKEERLKKENVISFLNTLNDKQKEIINMLLEIYLISGIDDLKYFDIFKLSQFSMKNINALFVSKTFGGKEKYLTIINELEKHIYSI